MARPERNTVDYFPFDCNEGKKMFYIEEKYGNNGFAVFIKLLRELAKTNYHYLNLSEKTTLMFLSAKCKVDELTLENIINDLVELGKFDKVLWNENRIVWCQDFIDSINDAYNKRNNNCISYDGLLIHLQGLGIRKQGKSISTVHGNTQSKVKYSKVKKSRENEEEKRNTPYSKILNLYHKKCPNLPKVLKLSDSRRAKIKVRWGEIQTLEKFEELFTKVGVSKFLNGENDRGWKADLDWLMENDKNWLKVIEGRYNTIDKIPTIHTETINDLTKQTFKNA